MRGEARLGLARLLDDDPARRDELARDAERLFEEAGATDLAAQARELKDGAAASDTD